VDDIQRIAEVVQQALLRRLGDEVELVFQYGSRLTGTTHKYSDVDISYVPAHEATWDSITVTVDEMLCDLYPIHWSKLDRMADFRDPSYTVLLNSRITYQRTEAAAQRFRALSARLRALQQPSAQPEMIRRAMEIFQETAYAYYLLRQGAAHDHRLACLQQAQFILRTVFHCLAACNQACIDTRKPEQVFALPKLPADFSETVRRITTSHEPDELLLASETLLQSTRDLLLAEQCRSLRSETTFGAAFDAAYPELKRDLQGILLACERQDILSLRGSLVSVYHEMSRAIAQVLTGVEVSDFNSLAEYEQDLAGLGFPAMTAYLETADFEGLRAQCLVFDQRLREFLSERSVPLNAFATVEQLQGHLEDGGPAQ
jgi:hypothetical protein